MEEEKAVELGDPSRRNIFHLDLDDNIRPESYEYLPSSSAKPRSNNFAKEQSIQPIFPGLLTFVKEHTYFSWMERGNIFWYSFLSIYIVSCSVLLAYLYRINYWESDTSQGTPVFFSCYDTLWASTRECGLNGLDCAPFNNESIVIRCPSTCLDPHSQYSVFGTGQYRADSYVCPAAIHSGMIGKHGGCANVKLEGSGKEFIGSHQNGVESFSSGYWFPKSFSIEQTSDNVNCSDIRWWIFGTTVALMSILTLVLSFLSIHQLVNCKDEFLFKLWWICLISSLAVYVSFVGLDRTEFPILNPLFNIICSGAVLFIVYIYVVQDNSYPIQYFPELIFLYSGPFYLGILYYEIASHFLPNLSADGDSLSHLSSWDILAILFVSIVIFIFIVISAWFVYKECLVTSYLKVYIVILFLIVFITLGLEIVDSDLYLHFHHYVIALLLLPLTKFPNHFSLVSQSFILGVLTNGIFIWGFDNLWVAPESQWQGTFGIAYGTTFQSGVDIQFTDYSVTNSSIFVEWESETSQSLVDSEQLQYSVQLSRMEVYRGYENNFLIENLSPSTTYLICLDFVHNGEYLGPGCKEMLPLSTNSL